MGDQTKGASSQQQHLLRIPNVAPDDVESGAIRLLSSDDNSSVRSASPSPASRRMRKISAPLPPLLMPSVASGQPPSMPPSDPDPGDSDNRYHHPQFRNHLKRTSTAGMSRKSRTPPPVPPRTSASAIAVAKRRPRIFLSNFVGAPLTPKPPRPNSQIIIPTEEDIKKNKKYYDMRMWKMGLDDMKNLKGDLLDHVQKVRAATTKSLSITQRILLWLSDTASSASSKWFTHILLVMFLFAYAALGGLLFQALEAPHEEMVKINVEKAQRDALVELWQRANEARTIDQFKDNGLGPLEVLQGEYYKAFNNGITSGFGKRTWTFWGSVFYCGTIITTIGYGHIAPVTSLGRLVTIMYAIFGIPILLMSLADFGKLFTRMVKAALALFRRLYYTGTCRRARRTDTMKAMSKGFTKAGQVVSDIASFQAPDLTSVPKTPGTPTTADVAPPPFEVDDEFDLPVSLALLVLVLYLFIGAIIFQILEGWLFLDSFYFVFISMSTIGLGDIVPEHEKFMMLLFIYLLFGLALTSMCINVVQESITHAFNDATTKLRAAIGMNLEAMEDDDATDDDGLNDGVLSDGDEKGDASSIMNSRERRKSKSAGPSNSRKLSKAAVKFNDSLVDGPTLASDANIK